MASMGHNGAIFGYSTWMLHSPEQDATLVVLANRGETETEFAGTIALDIAHLIFPDSFPSGPGRARDRHADVVTSASHHASAAGDDGLHRNAKPVAGRCVPPPDMARSARMASISESRSEAERLCRAGTAAAAAVTCNSTKRCGCA